REDAVAEYRGDFLDGLHVKGAAELDQWMDLFRGSVRADIASACWELAEQSSSVSANQASAWSAKACSLAPYDEGSLRRRLQLLHDAGDNAGALRTYAEIAELLKREFGAAPADATTAVADACRVEPAERPDRTDRVPAVAPTVPQSVPTEFIATSQKGGEPPDRETPVHALPENALPVASGAKGLRRLLLVAASAVLVAGAATAAVSRFAQSRGAARRTNDRIVVVPFDVQGAGPFGYLHDGIVDLLSGTLDGSGPLRAVDPHAVVAYTASLDAGGDPNELGKRVADKFGAAYFVSGRVLQSGGRMNVTATMCDANGKPVGSTHASGDESMLFAMVDSLTRQLLARRFGDPGARLMRLAFATTSSLPALKAYITGMHESRLGQFAEATNSFAAAVHLDSTFALALYEESVALAWNTNGRSQRGRCREAGGGSKRQAHVARPGAPSRTLGAMVRPRGHR
ncbi:MAG: BTAD domain-containing putative transcriptional regulator, partial [Gemmatimonadaceae bacterium]